MAQFPLIDQASLLMISGAYKEGKIYSQLPTDGSGDFTFTRGTDTATRVNKDGYIEKERVNLLLQSNQFDTTWLNSNSNETSGYSGYDGSNDAWLLTKSAANGMIYQSISTSGVQTLSVYAKEGTNSWIQIYAVGSTNVRAYYNLSDGTLGAYALNVIDRNIEDIGSGWYRCSVTFNSSLTSIRFFVSDGNNNDGGTSGSIYIQDAQLEQGLVATDYIETTTVPVYAGLTDNMPRLDYSGGAECGAYLLEPSRTQLVEYSEYFEGYTNSDFSITTNNTTSPEGITNGSLFEATGTSSKYIECNVAGAGTYTQSYFFKKGATSGYPSLSMFGLASNDYETGVFDFDAKTFDETSGSITSFTNVSYDYKEYRNGWFRLSQTFTASKANQRARIVMFNEPTPTLGSIGQRTWTANGESFSVWGWQTESGSYPTSYIPTYGSSQTRAADVSTVTKTLPSEGSLFINVGGTSQPKLSVLGEYFDASTTANKVAIAYSSTALVISHNGSIVVDKTGTYDVSSLTQIQLGHSNGADQADSPISEFITFDSFLTNNELNALTQ